MISFARARDQTSYMTIWQETRTNHNSYNKETKSLGPDGWGKWSGYRLMRIGVVPSECNCFDRSCSSIACQNSFECLKVIHYLILVCREQLITIEMRELYISASNSFANFCKPPTNVGARCGSHHLSSTPVHPVSKTNGVRSKAGQNSFHHIPTYFNSFFNSFFNFNKIWRNTV